MDLEALSTIKTPEDAKLIVADLINKNTLLEKKNQRIEEEKASAEKAKQELQLKYDRLLEQLKASRQKQYGSTSEQCPQQAGLFDEPGKPLTPEARAEVDDNITVTYKRKRKPKRKPLPDYLPREEVVIDIPEEEKMCCCGCALTCIGESISEQLDVIPAQIKVISYKRPKYACKNKSCPEAIKIAKRPNVLLPKAMASAGLVAHTIVNKYVDHIPLYRQEQQWKRHHVHIPRNSSCAWLMKTAEYCEPIYELLRKNIVTCDYVQADETPVQVHQEKDRKNTSKSYMWCYKGGPPDKPSIVFDYQAGRQGSHAQSFLEGFKGYLQCDAYSGYNFAERKEGMVRVGCMTHARRPFAQLVKLAESEGLAHEAVSYFTKLYQIETAAENNKLSFEERKQYRLEHAKPQLEALYEWLHQFINQVPAQSKLGEGMHYMLNNWEVLNNYLLDGRLSIDNNPIENLIRPFAIGRKNWLFMGSPAGARAGAIFYSLIATCRANNVEPLAYFQAMLSRIPNCKSQEDYQLLLPQNIIL